MTSANCYTVWNNKTDELLILDGTSKECAEAMGVTLGTFYSYLCKSKQGVIRWDIIESRKEQRERMIELVGKLVCQEGVKQEYIAQKYNMTRENVSYYVKKYRRKVNDNN